MCLSTYLPSYLPTCTYFPTCTYPTCLPTSLHVSTLPAFLPPTCTYPTCLPTSLYVPTLPAFLPPYMYLPYLPSYLPTCTYPICLPTSLHVMYLPSLPPTCTYLSTSLTPYIYLPTYLTYLDLTKCIYLPTYLPTLYVPSHLVSLCSVTHKTSTSDRLQWWYFFMGIKQSPNPLPGGPGIAISLAYHSNLPSMVAPNRDQLEYI